jgi:hypothetical protein
MQIGSILSGYSDPATLGKRTQPAEGAEAKLGEPLASPPTSAGSRAEVLGQIASQYDVTAITPEEFSEMMQQFYQANVLSMDELQDLAMIRVDLDRAGIELDEEVNLLELYGERLHRLEIATAGPLGQGESGEQSADVDATRRRFQWLQKLAVVQSAPEDVGLDRSV